MAILGHLKILSIYCPPHFWGKPLCPRQTSIRSLVGKTDPECERGDLWTQGSSSYFIYVSTIILLNNTMAIIKV